MEPGTGTGWRTRAPEPGGEGREAGEVLLRYRELALRLARGLVSRADLAEDVVQDAARAVLERAATGATRFESEEHARNYFLRAVHNRALDVLREGEHGRVESLEDSLGGEPVGPEARPGLEEREARVLETARVRRALASLRPAERELVLQRYLEGRAYRELAERTGESLSTLHSRVEAALAKIRRHVGKEGGRS